MKELLAPLFELFVYGVGAVAFTAAGIFAELTSFDYLSAGNLYFAAWLAVMGAVALYAGVFALGREEVLPRFRDAVGGN
jgi:hypothetical protein